MTGKWVVIGAGAIGGVVGAKLYEAGEKVVFVARGAHLKAIQANGLAFVDPSGRRTLAIPAVASVGEVELSEGDIVVLAVKAQHTAGALADLVAYAPAGIKIVCMQNGVDNERQASRFFSDVLGANVTLLGTYLEPGVVLAHSAPVAGTIQIGSYTGANDASVEAVARTLIKAGVKSGVFANIMAFKRLKLIVNLANVIEIVCLPGEGAEFASLLSNEAKVLFATAGQSLPDADAVIPMPEPVDPSVPRVGGSTKQSVDRGASSVETDFLNGEIVLMGRLFAVPTPANILAQEYARKVVRGIIEPNTVSQAELLAALERS
ncbi:MAG: ketopantoate reductase family protein [Propionibacteriaceae bacterium]|jgi:2-dehydropantoate 2-reductase|nr:ketopantoate reductase family protein [Propionibacteriaceae bacterium]